MGCLTFPFLVKISVQTSFVHEADGDGEVAEFDSALSASLADQAISLVQDLDTQREQSKL